jgi:hypothetical protein
LDHVILWLFGRNQAHTHPCWRIVGICSLSAVLLFDFSALCEIRRGLEVVFVFFCVLVVVWGRRVVSLLYQKCMLQHLGLVCQKLFWIVFELSSFTRLKTQTKVKG